MLKQASEDVNSEQSRQAVWMPIGSTATSMVRFESMK